MQLMSNTNEITVFYFGSIGDHKQSLPSKYSFEKDYTTGKLWNELQSKIDYSGEILVAVNHTYVDMKHILKHGDEVAFFPPVTGG